MAKLNCSFCTKKIKVKDLDGLPIGWGIIISKQGQCSLEFDHCPDHEHYKNRTLWDLIEKERSSSPSKASPLPF